jgi:LAS superfamily LD-carboxypeptidase LdcB
MRKVFIIILLSVLGFSFILKLIIKSQGVSQSDVRLMSLLGMELAAAREWQAANGLREDVAFGSTGEKVKMIQNALQVPVTGFFGPMTLEAVKNFQQENNLPVTGFVGSQTRSVLNNLYFRYLCPTSSAQYPDLSFLNVSKSVGLPEDYVPPNLASLSDYNIQTLGIVCLRKEAAASLAQMFNDAQSQGVNLAVTSGFRSYDVQKLLYDYWYQLEGAEALNEIAPPGHSEHQLGTAVDLTGASVHFAGVDKNFGDSPEGKWLALNAYKYGFVLSYGDQNASHDYIFEPWHYRFVGVWIANMLHESSGTLESYLKVFNEYATTSATSGVNRSEDSSFRGT